MKGGGRGGVVEGGGGEEWGKETHPNTRICPMTIRSSVKRRKTVNMGKLERERERVSGHVNLPSSQRSILLLQLLSTTEAKN